LPGDFETFEKMCAITEPPKLPAAAAGAGGEDFEFTPLH
jgi:hypothetical protein